MAKQKQHDETRRQETKTRQVGGASCRERLCTTGRLREDAGGYTQAVAKDSSGGPSTTMPSCTRRHGPVYPSVRPSIRLFARTRLGAWRERGLHSIVASKSLKEESRKTPSRMNHPNHSFSFEQQTSVQPPWTCKRVSSHSLSTIKREDKEASQSQPFQKIEEQKRLVSCSLRVMRPT